MAITLDVDYDSMHELEELACGVVDEKGSLWGMLRIPTGGECTHGSESHDSIIGYVLDVELLRKDAIKFEIEVADIITDSVLSEVAEDAEHGIYTYLTRVVTVSIPSLTSANAEDSGEEDEDEFEDDEEAAEGSFGDDGVVDAEQEAVAAIAAWLERPATV
jgi:hypothetical protein